MKKVKVDNDTYLAALRVIAEANQIFPEADLMDEAEKRVFTNSLNIVSSYKQQQDILQLFHKGKIL